MVEKIVICGSMKFLDRMLEWKGKLELRGYEVDIPTPEDFHKIRDEEGNLEKFNQIKLRETEKHFRRIMDSNVVLVLNYDKDGKENYIGGNTSGEIAWAVGLTLCLGKNIKIYTINPLPNYHPHYEEFLAWGISKWKD